MIGCGDIAGGFDKARVDFTHPYTHAGAYQKDGRFKIVACIDPLDSQRIRFMEQWNVPFGMRSVRELANENLAIDVVSICSPTNSHPEDIEMALKLKPKLIFCEKPISLDYLKSEICVKNCRDANILLMTNYTRRWDPKIGALKEDIASGSRGILRSISATYNKGILNNGSHMIDLLNFLLGPLKLVSSGKGNHDFFRDDPSITVQLESSLGIPAILNCANASDYAMFECQFIFSNEVVTMENGGLFWRYRSVQNSHAFSGYRELSEGVRVNGGYSGAMLNAVDNLYSAITCGAPLNSSGDSALATQKLCQEVLSRSINQ